MWGITAVTNFKKFPVLIYWNDIEIHLGFQHSYLVPPPISYSLRCYIHLRWRFYKHLLAAPNMDHLGERPHGGCTRCSRYITTNYFPFPPQLAPMLCTVLLAGYFHYNFILTKLATAQEEAVKVLESMPDPKLEE